MYRRGRRSSRRHRSPDGAHPDELRAISLGKPNIPADLDRALLKDAVNELDMDDLPDKIRYDLRAAFWEAFAELAPPNG